MFPGFHIMLFIIHKYRQNVLNKQHLFSLGRYLIKLFDVEKVPITTKRLPPKKEATSLILNKTIPDKFILSFRPALWRYKHL